MPSPIKITTEQHAAVWSYSRHRKCRINKATADVFAAGLSCLPVDLTGSEPLPDVVSESPIRKEIRISDEHRAALWVYARHFQIKPLGVACVMVFGAGLAKVAAEVPEEPAAPELPRPFRVVCTTSPQLRERGYACLRTAKAACSRLCDLVGGSGLIYDAGRLVLMRDPKSKKWLEQDPVSFKWKKQKPPPRLSLRDSLATSTTPTPKG